MQTPMLLANGVHSYLHLCRDCSVPTVLCLLLHFKLPFVWLGFYDFYLVTFSRHVLAYRFETAALPTLHAHKISFSRQLHAY